MIRPFEINGRIILNFAGVGGESYTSSESADISNVSGGGEMKVRIQYTDEHDQARGEAVLEAGNPTEAVVKFRCTQGPGQWRVTSVEYEDEDDFLGLRDAEDV